MHFAAWGFGFFVLGRGGGWLDQVRCMFQAISFPVACSLVVLRVVKSQKTESGPRW